jgi:hypothetical protein
MHLLLVEDDLELGAELQRGLGGHGLTSEWVRSAAHARALTDDAGARGSAQDSAPWVHCRSTPANARCVLMAS